MNYKLDFKIKKIYKYLKDIILINTSKFIIFNPKESVLDPPT